MSFRPERFQAVGIFSAQGSSRLIFTDNATEVDFSSGRTSFSFHNQ